MPLDNVFQNLSRFGLSPYEIKVLSTLLIEGEMTSTQVVRSSGVPQPRIYDIFNSLIRKGFIEVSPGKKKIYRAVPLSISVNKQIDELKDLGNTVEEFVKTHRQEKRTETPYVWLVEEEKQIDLRIRRMIDSAKKEIIFSVTNRTFDIAFNNLKKALARGVTVALVTFPDTSVERIKDLKGCVSRMRNSTASEVLIIDRNSALLNVGDVGSRDKYALYFDDDELIHVSNYYFFHTIWAPSKPVTTFDSARSIWFRTTWLACEALDQFFSNGLEITADMKCIINGNEMSLKGRITKTERELGMRHTFFIKVNNKTYSVGGRTARLEDAKLIEVEISTKRTKKAS